MHLLPLAPHQPEGAPAAAAAVGVEAIQKDRADLHQLVHSISISSNLVTHLDVSYPASMMRPLEHLMRQHKEMSV